MIAVKVPVAEWLVIVKMARRQNKSLSEVVREGLELWKANEKET